MTMWSDLIVFCCWWWVTTWETHESFPCRWQYETDFMNHAPDSQVFNWLSHILDLNSIDHAWHIRHYTSAVFHFLLFSLYIQVRYSLLRWRQKINHQISNLDWLFYLKYYVILENIFSLNKSYKNEFQRSANFGLYSFLVTQRLLPDRKGNVNIGTLISVSIFFKLRMYVHLCGLMYIFSASNPKDISTKWKMIPFNNE